MFRFLLEHQENCQFDALEIHSGPDENSYQLNKMCGATNSPTVMHTEGNNMYIKFTSDGSVGGAGFSARY